MPGGPTGLVLRDLHTLFRVGTAIGFTDGELIERFLGNRDETGEAAFPVLVERHAPMVFRVCREVLRDWHEAEDASQATFIVLAKKAGSIRERDSVASWLFGVACRVAGQAKAQAARRRRHEERKAKLAAAKMVQEDARMAWLELYEEIDRLPERLRVPLVLCYLKGHSQPEAAALLRCPVRTLQNRLARGQERLRRRLTRRGLDPGAGFWQASMGHVGSSAQMPVGWLEKTVRAAMATAHHTSTAGVVSASVAALTERMIEMMLRAKLKAIVAEVLVVGVLTVGLGRFAILAAGDSPQDKRVGGGPKATPPVSGGEIIVRAVDFSRGFGEERSAWMAAVDPETGKWRPIYKGRALTPGRVSPDGRYFLYRTSNRELPADEGGIWVYDMAGNARPRRVFEREGQPFWTHNGREVVIGTPVGDKSEKFETWRVSTDGTGRTKLPIPDGDVVLDCSRDGRWLATRTINGEPRHWGRLALIHPDGTGARRLTEGSANDELSSIVKISPDGRHIAYVTIKTVDGLRRPRLFVVDIDLKNLHELPVAFEPGATVGACWAPEGSRLALNVANGTSVEGSIALVDLDGSNYRKLSLPPGRWELHVCDWKALTPELTIGAVDDTPNLKERRARYEAALREISQPNIYEERRFPRRQTR